MNMFQLITQMLLYTLIFAFGMCIGIIVTTYYTAKYKIRFEYEGG